MIQDLFTTVHNNKKNFLYQCFIERVHNQFLMLWMLIILIKHEKKSWVGSSRLPHISNYIFLISYQFSLWNFGLSQLTRLKIDLVISVSVIHWMRHQAFTINAQKDKEESWLIEGQIIEILIAILYYFHLSVHEVEIIRAKCGLQKHCISLLAGPGPLFIIACPEK